MDIPIQIQNGTIQNIQQLDPTTTYLVYATWALVGATILIGYLTIKFSQKQYETLHRPWLVLDKSGRIVDNVVLSLENIGNLPAEKITVDCEYIFNEYEEKNTSYKHEDKIQIGIIVPKQKYQFTFNFLTIDEVMSCNSMTAKIFVRYYFHKKEKMCEFMYSLDNRVDVDEIRCEKAT